MCFSIQVHLKAHKRRNRTSKHQNVFWKTETVPIQELSVSIQNEILELQAAQKEAQTPKWVSYVCFFFIIIAEYMSIILKSYEAEQFKKNNNYILYLFILLMTAYCV